MQNAPQMIGFGITVDPTPPRKRIMAASTKKIIPIVMTDPFTENTLGYAGWTGLDLVLPPSARSNRPFRTLSFTGRRRGRRRAGPSVGRGDAFPHLQAMPRDSRLTVPAQSFSVAIA